MVFITKEGATRWAKANLKAQQASWFRVKPRLVYHSDRSVSFGYVVRFV